jgi:hypothetical protein
MKPPISKNGLKLMAGNNGQKPPSLAEHLKIGVQPSNVGAIHGNAQKQAMPLGGYMPG